MGIPSFYRWLVEKYPLSVADVLEEVHTVVNGSVQPVDNSGPNPNGIEFDNLYLDMNGIIHPCFHPENQPAPESYEEVFKAIFKYIDRIFSMIRPRKLLYMAIDGVAPRAKMNQQRARRFRSAKDAEDAAAEVQKSEIAFESNCRRLDSNVITPGTEFMEMLSSALHYYVHLRLNTDPGWCNIKVILSDANVPGEGEHKIMSYIRLQRNVPGFDPNTRHCLYGLDADLIMLALATHEVHFTILREDVRSIQSNDKSQKFGKGTPLKEQQNGKQNDSDTPTVLFQFLNIWVLRNYLEHDLKIPHLSTQTDLERLIDDFVFMCLFVGNDFLPHLPSLEIFEGAIDLLMFIYKKEFTRMGGYLTDSFEVDLKRLEHFLQVVACHENAIFRRRSQVRKEREIRFPNDFKSRVSVFSSLQKSTSWNMSSHKYNETSFTPSSKNSDAKNTTSTLNHVNCSSTDAPIDKIKLGEEGWKDRYYAEKFSIKSEDEYAKVRKHAVLKYTEGICWVMRYYYQGVCSWQWFYPYHYAPFASDFSGLDQLEISFTIGEPFKPFDQLMGVLPAASAHALPLYYRNLMTDPSSPIADFYPEDFERDMDGKRYAWQAICKLPFIKESRLLAEIEKVEHTLMDEERRRNSKGMDVLFVNLSHPLARKVVSFYMRNKDNPKLLKAKIKMKIDPVVSGGMNGHAYISDRTAIRPEICSPIDGLTNITKNQVLTVFYKYPSIHPHIPRLPEGVFIPGKSISKRDLKPPPTLWHEKTAVLGRLFTERPIPNSISGPCLAKLARQLVAKYYLEQKQKSLAAELQLGAIGGFPCLSKEPVAKEKDNCEKQFMKNKRGCKRGKKRKSGDAITGAEPIIEREENSSKKLRGGCINSGSKTKPRD